MNHGSKTLPAIEPVGQRMTARLILRPLTSDDSEEVIRLRTDRAIFNWRVPDTPTEAVTWLRKRLEDPYSSVYTVSLRVPSQSSHEPNHLNTTSREIIGLTGAHHLPEVGYIFEPQSWGKGYATEALKAWIQIYWNEHPEGHPLLRGTVNSHILKAETGLDADGSKGVLQKSGFVFDKHREVIEDDKTATLNCYVYTRTT